MTNLEILDTIILSENVVDNFTNEYSTNSDFNSWLLGIIPEIELCNNQKQNNPWHIYGVLDHILHSIESINKLTIDYDYNIRRKLSYTMLLHDIGKPKCHITRTKDGKIIDSFFNHNIESESVARRVLPSFNFSNKETDIIATLVNMHDIFMFIKTYDTNNKYWKLLTPSLIEEYIDKLNNVGDGNLLLKQLILVGRADNLAQNPKMTAESLSMLDTFEKMLDEIIIKKERTNNR